MTSWSICKTWSRAESSRQRMLNSKFELLSNTFIACVKQCKPWKDPWKMNQQEVKRGANWANAAVSSIRHFACIDRHLNLGMNLILSKPTSRQGNFIWPCSNAWPKCIFCQELWIWMHAQTCECVCAEPFKFQVVKPSYKSWKFDHGIPSKHTRCRGSWRLSSDADGLGIAFLLHVILWHGILLWSDNSSGHHVEPNPHHALDREVKSSSSTNAWDRLGAGSLALSLRCPSDILETFTTLTNGSIFMKIAEPRCSRLRLPSSLQLRMLGFTRRRAQASVQAVRIH